MMKRPDFVIWGAVLALVFVVAFAMVVIPRSSEAQVGNSVWGEVPITTAGRKTDVTISTVACTNVSAVPTELHRVWSTGAAETATLSLYNEGTSPSCSAADLVWSGIPSNTNPVWLDAAFQTGLSYKFSGTPVNSAVLSQN